MKKLLAILLIFGIPVCFCACGERQGYQKTVLSVFDTVTVISGYEDSKETFDERAKLIEQELIRYHKLYDIYSDYGGTNLKTVNDRAGEAVSVDSEIIDMLVFGVEMYEKTDGKTNIAIGAVTSLWHEAREEGVLPEDGALKAASEHTDIGSIVIDKDAGTVRISDPLAKIDVLAVAKGYACDRVCEMIRDKGWDGYGLSIGGNVKTVGKKGDGSDWKIGVQDPEREDAYFCTVEISDVSLVTSGSYQRYFEVDGVRYHHIIDPETLYPADIYTSVTVICSSSAMGDALSTALFSMEYEDALKLLENYTDTEVIWRFTDGTVKHTDGIGDRLIFK